MKYVFFGSPRFAEIVLGHLIKADIAPVALVCNPDRPVGRKKVITAPATKQRAIKSDATNIDIIQPEMLDEPLIKRLRALEPDFFVVAAYAKIIPQTVLDIPRLGTVGVHPSLLPKYRGASPIQSVLLNGEPETGTTLYVMDAKMDHGPILAQDAWPIADNEQYPQLEEELAHLSGALLVKTLPDFFAQKITGQPQDEKESTLTRKFTTEDGYIEETHLAAAERGDEDRADFILRAINALTPEPGAWTKRDGKRVKLLAGEIKDGKLRLMKTQIEGEKPKDVQA